jgi:Serine/Threonine/Tyrosine Kinase found in polyvalent proteins
MLSNDIRNKIQNITSGTIIEGQSDTCTTIRNFLCSRFATSTTVKTNFEGKRIIKEEQARILIQYAKENGCWINKTSYKDRFLAKGGEATVYFDTDGRTVIKWNDAIYYATWFEFFNSIVIHNLIFPNTRYTLEGFILDNEKLVAILKQPFIQSDATVDLESIKQFLRFNGFENHIRHDYWNKELGLLLEDMHDENVLVKEDTLFFIDTVFYIVK